jgi:hypothetical protein
MKKSTMTVWIACILALILSGCSGTSNQSANKEGDTDNTDNRTRNGFYQVLVYDYSDSIPSADHTKEYEIAYYDEYDQQPTSTNIEYSINGILYEGTYDSIKYLGYNYFPVYEYKSENGFSFCIDNLGNLANGFLGG